MCKPGRRAATIVILTLLVVLFLLPRAYLARTGELVKDGTAAARAALNRGESAVEALRVLEAAYAARAPVLKLFLSHATVDALEVALVTALPLTEPEAVHSALNAVDAAMAHLLSIESLCAENLL